MLRTIGIFLLWVFFFNCSCCFSRSIATVQLVESDIRIEIIQKTEDSETSGTYFNLGFYPANARRGPYSMLECLSALKKADMECSKLDAAGRIRTLTLHLLEVLEVNARLQIAYCSHFENVPNNNKSFVKFIRKNNLYLELHQYLLTRGYSLVSTSVEGVVTENAYCPDRPDPVKRPSIWIAAFGLEDSIKAKALEKK